LGEIFILSASDVTVGTPFSNNFSVVNCVVNKDVDFGGDFFLGEGAFAFAFRVFLGFGELFFLDVFFNTHLPVLGFLS
jgi:hypothetical protein